ncbi:heat stress transcription factor A-5 [Magnolia sinica]|uniref:heat stress transcription factor A-5 n=1 Tax=Magnolia sinica TaxID=86752 RepID=UPI0026589362|nr:heat stress transcription factor A-5 [Magnolia sinica]
MEGGGQGSGGSGGGPAPFLLKTYDMVDDSSTDEIVSWSSNKNSFVVWNPPEFARLLLPTYFKHNNFSSFIRQLNTYGFRKIDPERWEFANEDFSKDQKHLLKNIHRRKPIHSHSQQHSFGDPERSAFEEEIERLTREKTALQSDLWKFKQQQPGMKLQLEDLERRVHEMEQRQLRMMSFLAKAINNPAFVDHLIRMAGSSVDFEAINKKRRLPKVVDYCQEVEENSYIDNHSSNSKPEAGHAFHQDFHNKLKLELSPAVSDSNLVSASMQSSTEDGVTPKPSEGAPIDANMRTEGLSSFAPETLELSDTGTSFSLGMNISHSRQLRTNESPDLHGLRRCLATVEDCDSQISCQLNLTLASSPLQVKNSYYPDRVPLSSGLDIGTSTAEFRSIANGKEPFTGVKSRSFGDEDASMSSLREAPTNNTIDNNNQGPAAAQGRVNDMFWEQFLTERPGSLENEEASSSFRANACDDQEERRTGSIKSWRSKRDMEQLTL